MLRPLTPPRFADGGRARVRGAMGPGAWQYAQAEGRVWEAGHWEGLAEPAGLLPSEEGTREIGSRGFT